MYLPKRDLGPLMIGIALNVRAVEVGSDPAAPAAFFARRSTGPGIPEFFSRSVVSLVTAKGEPREV